MPSAYGFESLRPHSIKAQSSDWAFIVVLNEIRNGRGPRGAAGRLRPWLTTGSGRGSCHSGGFLLRIMPPSWPPVPACAPRLCCRRAIPHCSSDDAASILKFEPEIKNRCTKEGVNGEKLTSIPKSGPEIKNRRTKEGVNRQNPAAIRKSGPEIKNHCTQEGVNRQNPAVIPKLTP